MTVRGGGVPRKPWLSCRCAEWARRLGASLPMRKTASWSGSLRPTEYKVAARLFVRHQRAPLEPRHPDHNERAAVLGFVKVWPGIAESMRRYLSDGQP